MKKYIIFLILAVIPCFAFSKTFTVTSGADAGEGTLRQAITDAEANDTITFAGNVATITLTNYGFTLDKNITIIGNEENNTVITGNTRHFTLKDLAAITVSLNNLTLKNGYAITCGGSIFNRKSNTLILNNCVFVNNRVGTTGGAVDNLGNLTINNCTFENNQDEGSVAGAINNGSGNEMSINRSTFINNISEKGAGAVYNSGIITITDCIFKGNKGVVASVFWNRDIATVVNCLFIRNEHISSGTVVYDRSGTISNYTPFEGDRGILTVINSTIADNTDDDGLYNDTQVTLYNNVIYNNSTNDVYTTNNGTTNASYNLIGTSNINLSGNNNLIGEDPLCVGNGDYSLQEGSPAIDAGSNAYLAAGTTEDLLGNPRISNSTVDMGAYEFQQSPISSLNNTPNEQLKVYIQNLNIIVENATQPVSIYDMLGHLMAQGVKTEFAVPQAGVYIVRTGNEVRKIVVY